MPKLKKSGRHPSKQGDSTKVRRQRKRKSQFRTRTKFEIKKGEVRRLHSIYETFVDGSVGRIITAETGSIRSFIWRDAQGKKILIDRIIRKDDDKPIDLAQSLKRFQNVTLKSKLSQRNSSEDDGGQEENRIIIVVNKLNPSDRAEILHQVKQLEASLRNRVELVNTDLEENRDRAIEALKQKYTNIKFSKFTKLTEAISGRFWNTYMRNISIQQMVERILDGYLPDDQKGKPISLTIIEQEAPKGIRLQIEVVNHEATDEETLKSQETLFSLNLVLKEEDKKFNVYIEGVTANNGGKKLFRESLLPLFGRLKVNKLSLNASRIGGGDEGVVAWARYGFIPDKASWNKMRENGLKQIKNNKEPWAKQMRAVLKKNSPRSIRELVLLSWKNRDEVKPILDKMLRHAFSWPGTMDLTNQQDLEWVTKYTAENPSPPEEFEMLLSPK